MLKSALSLKTLMLSALLAASAALYAQGEEQWYSGHSAGFWGLGESIGVRGALPGMFNPPGASAEFLNTQRLYGGYRITDAFAIEGAQTTTPNAASCGDILTGDSYRGCRGPAWSLSGVATLPFQSGLSVYGRLGLHYRQQGLQDESNHQGYSDEPGVLGQLYGIGLSYGLTKSMTVHAESEHYSDLIGNGAFYSKSGTGIGLNSSVHSIGLSIRF